MAGFAVATREGDPGVCRSWPPSLVGHSDWGQQA